MRPCSFSPPPPPPPLPPPPLGLLPADAPLQLLQPPEPLDLHLVGNQAPVVLAQRRARLGPGAGDERELVVIANRLGECDREGEVLLRLAGEAHDDVRGHRDAGTRG